MNKLLKILKAMVAFDVLTENAKKLNMALVDAEKALVQSKKGEAQNLQKRNTTGINLQQEMEKELKAQEKVQSDMLAMLRKTELERIQLKKASIEKELALLDHKRKVEMDELDKMAHEWEKAQGGDLNYIQKREIETRRTAVNEHYQANVDNVYAKDVQKEHEAMMTYLKEYGDYHEKITAIRETYQTKIENTGILFEKQRLQKQMQGELAGVESEMIKSSKAWKIISGELSGFSNKLVHAYLEQAKASLANTSELSEGEINKLTQTIENAEQTIRQRNPFKSMHESLLLYREALENENPEEAAKHLTSFKESAESAKTVIKDITTGASGIGNLVSKDLGNAVTQIGGMFEGVAGMIKGFGEGKEVKIGEKVKGISGIISAATTIIGDLIDAAGESDRAAREYEEFRLEFLNQYYMLLMSIKEEDYNTIFGVETLSRSIDAFSKLTEVSAKYQESLRNVDETAKHNRVSGDLWGKETHKQNSTRRKALEKGYDELQSMTILTSEANFWQKLVGKGSRYTTLKDLAPELWDENGKFDVKAAKIFLETNKAISKSNNAAQKATIENLIELENKYEELMAIVRADLKDTFGYIGGAITDQLVNAIKNGGDAWDDFKNVGVKALETLGKKLLYELFFAQKLKKLQEDMEKIYEEEDDPEEIGNKQAALMDTFFNGLEKDVDNAQIWAQQWKDKMAEKGYNIWQPDPEEDEKKPGRTATAQGITSMSQDTASELNGNFYALFMTVDNIHQSIERWQETEDSKREYTLPTLTEMLDVSKSSNTYLLDIRNNTSHLIAIDSNIEYMNNNILALRNDGVKIRS